MYIEFTKDDGTRVMLNTAHIVSIELPTPLPGMQGGAQQIRLHCLEGRVYSFSPKVVSFEDLLEQIKPKELNKDVRSNQDSPVG